MAFLKLLKQKTGSKTKTKTKTGTKTGTTTVTNDSKDSKEKEKPKEKTPQKVQKYFRSPITVFILAVLVVVGLAAAVVLITLYLLKDPQIFGSDKLKADGNNGKPKVPICDTPDCLTLAYQLANYQDSKTNPCDDFYQFSCGRYAEYSNDENPHVEKRVNMRRIFRKFLKSNEIKPETLSNSEKIMRKINEKCEDRRKNYDEKALAKELFKKLKGITEFPLTKNKWKAGDFDLNKALQAIAKAGQKNFGLFQIEFMEEANEKWFLIKPPESVDALLSPAVVQHLKSSLKSNNIQIPETEVDLGIQQAFNHFNYMASFDDTNSDKEITLNHLASKLDIVDFRNLFLQITPNFDQFKTNDYELFFSIELNQNLKSVWDMKQTANLLFFILYDTYVRDIAQIIDCGDLIIERMPRAAIRYYARNHVKRENRKAVIDLTNDISTAYMEMFAKNTWMSDVTRELSRKKVREMTKHIGYDEQYEQEGHLDGMYDEFISSGVMQQSLFKMLAASRELEMRHLVEYVMSNSTFNPFDDNVFNVGGFYQANVNRMTLLIPSFDEPFFDASFPKYAQLAGTGRLIATLIGAAFNDEGRLYQSNGAKGSLWSDKDVSKFEEKTQCLTSQYANYEDPDWGRVAGIQIERQSILSQYIADFVGTFVSWNAYKNNKSSEDLKLSGFEDSNTDKLFWQIGALQWCEHRHDKEDMKNRLQNDPIAVKKFRVNGVYQNMPGFSEAFGCPVGSPMNPSNKCELY